MTRLATAEIVRTRRFRPRLELLEPRLPPGDTALAGLLAQGFLSERAAGLVPADGRAVPPGPVRRLAVAAPFDLELCGDVLAPANLIASAPGEPRTEYSVPSTQSLDTASRGTSVLRAASPVASAAAELGTPYSVLGTPYFVLPALTRPGSPGEAANYQLDQAVAALAPLDDQGSRSAGVYARFNLGHPSTGPFPSNWFTVGDDSQLTDRRVNLPYPDCKVYVSDCEDIAVLNELDGFNLQPRLSIPFSGPIDVDSVSYQNVFLVSLGSTTDDDRLMPRGYGVGINQIVWDVATNTLHVESDELLAQHTRFGLYVTRGVRDTQGDPVQASPTFLRFLHRGQGEYHDHLLDAMLMAEAYGFEESDIAVASVFTTQSATAVLEKIRDQIKAATPEQADFLLGEKGERTVFDLDDVTGITWRQQTGDNPPVFNPVQLDLRLPRIVPGVSQVAFGKYFSPDYLTPERYIPSVGTRTGTPVVQGVNELFFDTFLPSGPMPAGGWPVAIVGHGSTGSTHGTTPRFAASMASQGIATIGINAVGHGFGPLGTLSVSQTVGGEVTFPAGGRGIDLNGNGIIGADEGIFATPPYTLVRGRDGERQTAADLMQLVRVIEVGMDANGDGVRDLNPSRMYYFGHSLGGYYGTDFVAVEPSVRTGVFNVTGGSLIEATRLSPIGRPNRGTELELRVPSLLNAPGLTSIGGIPVAAPHFNENKPFRNQPPVTNTVVGAMAIQEMFEHSEWARQPSNPVAFAPYLRKAPLAGVSTKSVIFHFARGDRNAPNLTTTAILRAGDLADRTTFFRNDLAFAENPAVPRNPHNFLGNIDVAAVAAMALSAQEQIATFFASDGKTIIHPEPARFFEVPIQGPLPEELNYIV